MNFFYLMWFLLWFSEMYERNWLFAITLYLMLLTVLGFISYNLTQLLLMMCDVVFLWCVNNLMLIKVGLPFLVVQSV